MPLPDHCPFHPILFLSPDFWSELLQNNLLTHEGTHVRDFSTQYLHQNHHHRHHTYPLFVGHLYCAIQFIPIIPTCPRLTKLQPFQLNKKSARLNGHTSWNRTNSWIQKPAVFLTLQPLSAFPSMSYISLTLQARFPGTMEMLPRLPVRTHSMDFRLWISLYISLLIRIGLVPHWTSIKSQANDKLKLMIKDQRGEESINCRLLPASVKLDKNFWELSQKQN